MANAVLGAGFVGVATATWLATARKGRRVWLLERDPARLAQLSSGQLPFHEPDLEAQFRVLLQAGRLQLADRLPARLPDRLRPSAVFITVGTPEGADGNLELNQVWTAGAEAAGFVAARGLIVLRSTVPPGTTQRLAAEVARLRPKRPVTVAFAPEFLREGSAWADTLRPSRVVVGAPDPETAERVARLLRPPGRPLLLTDPVSAEMIKLASNAMLAARVSLVNELTEVARAVGADASDVLRGMAFDWRIGGHYLRPGLGFGGACLPKDLAALIRASAEAGADSGLLAAVARRNELQLDRVVDQLSVALGGLAGRRVAVLGLAFKPGTDDVRGSRSLALAERLHSQGAKVVAHDPLVRAGQLRHVPWLSLASTLEEALRDALAAVIATPWPEYRGIVAQAGRVPIVIDRTGLTAGG